MINSTQNEGAIAKETPAKAATFDVETVLEEASVLEKVQLLAGQLSFSRRFYRHG